MTVPVSSPIAAPPVAAAAALEALLARTPLAPGEDKAAYQALRASMIGALNPTDAIEAIWTHEAVDLCWELQRHKQLRTHHLARSRVRVVRRILSEELSPRSDTFKMRMRLISRWQAGDPDAVAQVEVLLSRKGYDDELLVLEAHDECLPQFEFLDRMKERIEHRRSRLLREVERRRAFALRVRASLERPASKHSPDAATGSSLISDLVTPTTPEAGPEDSGLTLPNGPPSRARAPLPADDRWQSGEQDPSHRDERLARTPDALLEGDCPGHRPNPSLGAPVSCSPDGSPQTEQLRMEASAPGRQLHDPVTFASPARALPRSEEPSLLSRPHMPQHEQEIA